MHGVAHGAPISARDDLAPFCNRLGHGFGRFGHRLKVGRIAEKGGEDILGLFKMLSDALSVVHGSNVRFAS